MVRPRTPTLAASRTNSVRSEHEYLHTNNITTRRYAQGVREETYANPSVASASLTRVGLGMLVGWPFINNTAHSVITDEQRGNGGRNFTHVGHAIHPNHT